MKSNTFNELNGKNLNIAIVKARFNHEITDSLARGARKALEKIGVKSDKISQFTVPGAFEIPYVCQKLALSGKYHGIITIGAVVKGETAHFEYISQAVVSGIMEVMLKTKLPIALGVITAYNPRQAKARSRDDKANKGYEAALALAEMIINYK